MLGMALAPSGTNTEIITVKSQTRYRLQVGFEDDFAIIDAQVIRVEPVEIEQEERIEWIDAEVPVMRFRIRSSVVLGLFGILLAGVGFVF